MAFRVAILLLFVSACVVAGAPLEISVRDARTGTPLSDAVIEIRGPEGSSGLEAHEIREAVTGGDGIARFPDGPSGRYRAFLRKEGYAPAFPMREGLSYDDPTHGFVRSDAASRVELLYAPPLFTPTGGVRGRITATPGDRPVRDAGILVVEGGRAGRVTHTTATNGQGGYAVYGIAPGPVRVTITASGYGKIEKSVTVAPSSTVTLPVSLGTGAGRIVGSIFSDGSIPIPGVHVTATRSDGILITTVIIDVRGGGREDEGFIDRATAYALEGVPALPPGSTLTYTVRASASAATMTQPVNGVTGLAVRAPGQTVTATPIRLAAMQGGLQVTLYHGHPLAAMETESYLSSIAPQAVVSVEGTNAYGRYMGESPARFYSYLIADAPAGQRRLRVSFPGHAIAPGQEEVFIPVGGQARVLIDLRER